MIDINFNPPKRDLRIFALLLPVFFGIVAWVVFRKHDNATVAIAIASSGAAMGAVCFVAPVIARYVYVGWMIAVFPIGWVVSHILLAVMFYGIVTPIGLIMQLCGRDPMRRRFDPDATTYWVKRFEQAKAEQYFRQF